VYNDLLAYSDEEVNEFFVDSVITTEHDIQDILRPRKPKQAVGGRLP